MDLTTALSAEHYTEIVIDSAIEPEVASARGYRTLTGTGEDRDTLEEAGFARAQIRDESFPLLLIPMRGMNGEIRGHQIKPARPRTRLKESTGERTPIKYETPFKAPLCVDVPLATAERLRENPSASLWVTEGMKKTDCLVSRGMACVGLTGVFNWRNKLGALGDWEDIPIKDRPVVLCFDADASSNRHVQLAMSRAGAWFKSRGASAVHYLVVPGKVGETETKGVDDYFAAGGDMDALAAAATALPPGAGEKDASFTDAFLVEDLAEALQGRFCWASGLGWLRWTGRVWKEVSEVEPLEAVRQWTSEQFDKALDEQKRDRSANLAPKIQGWRSILNKGRLVALKDLSKGLVQRDAAEFDGDPDLLTVLNGTLHLPSGRLLAFDPEHCITKSADAEYIPGYRHPQWAAALRAVPEDLHEWFQDRMGQALTGYPTPDHTLVIGCGTGSNGKSTIADVVRKTMGGYGILVSDRVIMANPDAHPTELMDLRGARYAVLEETPEARHLNVQRLKIIAGTPVIRARRIRMDTVEFIATHSLFINTNYKPTVTETDWGTWRRLALQTFPFTFKKAGQPLESAWDRAGDPALAYASNDPEVRAAALAWMAAGAQRWYARGRMMLPHPETVERHTREWRAETDLILGFSDEMLTFDPQGFVQTREMLQAFNDWAGERGHRPWNDRTFATRFGDHDTVRAAKVRQGRFSIKGKQMRGWSGVSIDKGGRNPWTGEQDEPPTPDPLQELTELGQEFEAAGVGTPEDRPPHLFKEPVVLGFDQFEHEGEVWEIAPVKTCGNIPGDGPACDWDPSCKDHFPAPDMWDDLAPPTPHPEDADSEIAINTVPQYAPFREPVVLGFDLETAAAEELFTGKHEGPFVRLPGVILDYNDMALPKPHVLIEELNHADVIYGHNILGFDLIALAHHHGADYDALAAKAVDTMVLERLIVPPMSKGMPNGYYGLDEVAHRIGHEGKTDDLKGLAKRYGGFDRIPIDSREYQDYLRGDLAATKAVYDARRAELECEPLKSYAEREMRVVALQNRMTLNGWKVDEGLLAERVTAEDEKRRAAVEVLHEKYGVPLAKPDRFKLKPKAEWPDAYYDSLPVKIVRRYMNIFPEGAVARGIAERIPGETYQSPWATDAGRDAIVRALAAAGAPHYPVSAKSGQLMTSSDALGSGNWYCPVRRKSFPGLMKAYPGNEAVAAIVNVLGHATGARIKYAEISQHVTAQGRVHAWVGAAQGSGRWAMTKPSITNMGSRGAAAEERAVLVADEGHLLLTVDASQVDMRAMAGLSQDPAYMKLFEPGRNAHREMSVVYFGEATDESYRRTKAINHKLNYGGGAQSTADMNGIPLEVVQHAIAVRAQTYPRLVEYIDEVRELAATGQLLDNGFGRLMRADPERAWTQGPALMGQGCARDICTTSLLRLVEARPDVTPFLRGFVHDELVLSVPADTVEEWREELRRAFTWEWRGVPILCDLSTPALRWVDCK